MSTDIVRFVIYSLFLMLALVIGVRLGIRIANRRWQLWLSLQNDD